MPEITGSEEVLNLKSKSGIQFRFVACSGKLPKQAVLQEITERRGINRHNRESLGDDLCVEVEFRDGELFSARVVPLIPEDSMNV